MEGREGLWERGGKREGEERVRLIVSGILSPTTWQP